MAATCGAVAHHNNVIIMFIVSNNINSYTYNQSADQLLNTFKAMEKKQIAYVSFFNYILNTLCATMSILYLTKKKKKEKVVHKCFLIQVYHICLINNLFVIKYDKKVTTNKSFTYNNT